MSVTIHLDVNKTISEKINIRISANNVKPSYLECVAKRFIVNPEGDAKSTRKSKKLMIIVSNMAVQIII